MQIKSQRVAFATLIFCIVFTSCGKRLSNAQDLSISNSDETSKGDTISFVPDVSVNGLFLDDKLTVEGKFGDLMDSLVEENDFYVVYLLNSSKEQYLKLIFFNGNPKNRFHVFEVGYLKHVTINIKKDIVLPDYEFETESGISLGITKSQLLKIKGAGVTQKDGTIITYVIDDFPNSLFLKKFNMPKYFAQYTFEGEKMIKYRFGFEFP